MQYPSAKVVLCHPKYPDHVLLVRRRSKAAPYYEPAGGKVEINVAAGRAETFEQCAIREVREELGVVVELGRYLGSYYFFWTMHTQKCSVCAVFVGTIMWQDPAFAGNEDTHELDVEPAWVRLDDIRTGVVTFNPLYVGLQELCKAYAFKGVQGLHKKRSFVQEWDNG